MVQTAALSKKFVPSEQLVGMFVDGARRYFERARASGPEAIIGLTSLNQLDLRPAHVSAIIAERAVDVLLSLGGRYQTGVLKDDVVARENFPKEIEEEIIELLPIDEEHGHQFCQLLLKELKGHLSEGGVIAGQWGHVALRDNGEMVVVRSELLTKRPGAPRARLGSNTIKL